MASKKETLAQAQQGQGCLGRASDDEPVFILRAKDLLASAVVDHWADEAEAVGTSKKKVNEARTVAKQMRAWPNRKYPD